MKKYLIVSDVHYQMEKFVSLVKNLPKGIKALQLGDLLLGLPSGKQLPKFHHSRMGFIRGNHDDPKVAKEHPNYLGDYGYIKEGGIFYISGALSPDYFRRKINKDWWPDEQLNHKQFANVISLYQKTKPKILISHDCPYSISKKYFGYGNNSLTQQILEILPHFHKVDEHIFGHLHKNWHKTVNNIRYRCLGIMETYEVNIS